MYLVYIQNNRIELVIELNRIVNENRIVKFVSKPSPNK